jgi:hypothetical protein
MMNALPSFKIIVFLTLLPCDIIHKIIKMVVTFVGNGNKF